MTNYYEDPFTCLFQMMEDNLVRTKEQKLKIKSADKFNKSGNFLEDDSCDSVPFADIEHICKNA